MPDKKFLGLGFTFSAKDQGLDKKLKSVDYYFHSISQSLKFVNKRMKEFQKRGSSVSTLSEKTETKKNQIHPSQKIHPLHEKALHTFSQAREQVLLGKHGQRHIIAQQKKKVEDKLTQKNTFTDQFEDIFPKLSTDSKKFMGNISDIFNNKYLFEAFKEKISDVNVSFDKTGTLTQDTQKKLHETAASFMKDVNVIDVTFRGMFGKWIAAVEKVGSYFGDIKESAENFLGTLGVEFTRIIPPQFTAGLKLFGSILKGPIKLMFSGFKNIFKKKIDEKKDQTVARFKDLAGTSLKSTQDFLSDKTDPTEQDVSSKLGPSKTKNLYTLMRDFLKKTSNLGSSVDGQKEDESLMGKIQNFLKWVGVAGIAIAGLYGAFKLFGGEKLYESFKEKLSNVGSYIADKLTSIVTYFEDLGKSIFNAVKSFSDFLIDIPNKFKNLFSFGSDNQNNQSSLLTKFTSWFKSDDDKNTIQPVQTNPQNLDPQFLRQQQDQTDHLRDAISNQQQMSQGYQNNLMQQNVELQKQILDQLMKNQSTPVPSAQVNINADARKMGFFQTNSELTSSMLQGT